MPKRKTSRRAPSRTRTIVRRVSSTARRVGHRARSAGSKLEHNLLTKLLFFGSGYFLSDAIDGSGLGILMYSRIPGFRDMVDAAYQQKGFSKTFGQIASKAGGLGLLLHSLYQSRHGTIPKGVMDAELPFALGLTLDDPSGMGGTSSLGSSSTQYW